MNLNNVPDSNSENNCNLIDLFSKKLSENNLDPKQIIPDGKIHRFDIDKPGDKAGWYALNIGSISYGAFGNWKTGMKIKWSSASFDSLNCKEKDLFIKQQKQIEIYRKSQEQINQEKAKKTANFIWSKSLPLKDKKHPYLADKMVDSHGLRISRQGDVVIPLFDSKGDIWSLQFIKVSGKKRFLPMGKKKGMFYKIRGNNEIYICEGYATAKTVHDLTGGTAICSFDSGNLESVSLEIRQQYKKNNIYICADNDQFTDGNPGIKKGKYAAKAIGAKLLYPVFKDISDKPTDFNDLVNLEGEKQAYYQLINKTGLIPLTERITNISSRLKSKPEPMEFILNYNNEGLIPKGIVGVLTATGGVGKTFFLLSLAVTMSGGKSMGPLNAKPVKTLVICGEDDQSEIDRRLWNICEGDFPKNLHAISVYGEVGPLMRLEKSVPYRSEGFYWLEETIKGHPDLELIILDPKSRFYGLDENSSDHSTQWIQCLEYLAKKYSLTILFSHHTTKDSAGKISQNMSRGSSAIVDGCRWQGGLARISEEFAGEYGLDNPRDYIFFDTPKSNYSSGVPRQTYFKRNKDGVLSWVDPQNEVYSSMAEELHYLLINDEKEYSLRDLIRNTGQDIRQKMKEIFPSFKTKDLTSIVNTMINNNLAEEVKVVNGKKPKTLINPK